MSSSDAHTNADANAAAWAYLAQVVLGAVQLVQAITPQQIEQLRLTATGSQEGKRTRNKSPCGTCSKARVKCDREPGSPFPCSRCIGKGLNACPPHAAWEPKRAKNQPTPPFGDQSPYMT